MLKHKGGDGCILILSEGQFDQFTLIVGYKKNS